VEDKGPAGAEEEAEDKDDCPVCLQSLGAQGGGGGAHRVRARVPRDVPGRVGVHVREEAAGRDLPVVQGAGQQVARLGGTRGGGMMGLLFRASGSDA
jgi:hypothetical protein